MEGKQPVDGKDNNRRRTRAAATVMWLAPGTAINWRLRGMLLAEHWRARLDAAVESETERRTWFNWLPVAFGCGIAAYFVADREPLWWGPPLALTIFGALAFTVRAKAVAFAVMLALAAASAGLFMAGLRTERVRAPAIERTTIAKLSGFVEAVEERTGDMRLVVAVTSFGALAASELPHRVRVTAPKSAVLAGEHLTFTARLMPPPEAARPGGYDFARDAYFRGIGAVGSGLGRIERTPELSPAPRIVRLNASIDMARNAMTERIATLIGGQAGAVAAALVTGKRGLISDETNDILRGAGIYHIVSISGLHMVLAAGAIFWMVRAILALFPAIALTWPVKKVAAVCAMLGATAYCIFSGSEVATERSLIMTLIMLGAILADRPALSMRNLALAAMVVLALEPDAMLGPSFQMSFGAVAALIAFAEWQRRRVKPDKAEPGLVGRAIRSVQLGLAGMFITSVLAALATGPFAAFHFQTYNPFGLLGNMLALPFVSLIVMPAAVAGALLYPLGLDAVAWWLMGLATAPVLGVSSFVAGLGGSTQIVPAYGKFAVSCFAAALILSTLLSTWLRLFAILPLALGVGFAANPQRADIFIDRDAAGVAARKADGRLAVMGRPGSFVLEQWLKADGDNRKPDDNSIRQGAACDPGGCVVTLPDGRAIAWSRDPATVSEDCARADLVVTPLRWDGACAALMVDRRTLDRFGSIAVKSTPGGLVATTSRNPDAPRQWTRKEPPPRALATPAAAVPVADEDINSAERD
jgi:competence protein ComEC